MIAILDFGSQYTQLIARRIREQNVYCRILPYNPTIEELKEFKGIILSGGPASVYDLNAPHGDSKILQSSIPVLGICYGMQWLAHALGGEVKKAEKREYGKANLQVVDATSLLAEIPTPSQVWMSHGDRVETLPSGFKVIGKTTNSPTCAIGDYKRNIYGVQFHPEVIHTTSGTQIIKNFLFKICNLKPTWTMESFIEHSIKKIQEEIGDKKVICALSGGVDSSTVAVLLHKAIGNQLICIFVNNGLLRKNEAERVIKTFRDYYHINLDYCEAQERFLTKLKRVSNPELKRKIIGHEFIKVFEDEAKKIGKVDFLAQGTLYPDVIESISTKGPSAIIKTHHNVGGLPAKMKLRLIEPFRELFKDEVRILAKELGLPDEIIWQHPFPGPGLAIRIIGAVTSKKLNILREADWIIDEETKKAGLYLSLWQCFGVFLPVKTVGVMGDERTYENVLAIRAVTSQDAMTADWAQLPHSLLSKISNRIVNEVKGINRVVYDITSKPPGTIEWE
ncbi:MAG: glutamine-hydrolyzing GMP synthase [Nitrospirota bacterium]